MPKQSFVVGILLFAGSFFAGGTGFAQDPLEKACQAAVAVVSKSVVQIETIGGLEKIADNEANLGPSTGIVVSEDGYIVTSAFNLVHKPAGIFVRWGESDRVPAEIAGRDISRNLVLLKVKTDEKLVVPQTVSRDDLQVGQSTIAVGKTYSPVDSNISLGVLSATHRIWDRAVQTDAKVSSSNFGGPLIDLQGRVIGILAPLSPNANGVIDGADWYDSGIGFAVPLDEFMTRLETLKEKRELKRGLIGVTFAGADVYASKAIVAVCSGGSPAAAAGLRPKDEIVQINGREINRQAQLKHVLGPLYAGDKVECIVNRAGKEISLEFKLVASIEPYQPTQLGLFLNPKTLEVTSVIPDSPASESGIKTADVIESIDNQSIQSVAEIRRWVANKLPGESVSIRVKRSDKDSEFDVVLGPMTAQPLELDIAESDAECTVDSIQLSDFKNKVFAIVPDNENSKPASLLVWVEKPGDVDQEAVVAAWSERCAKQNMIVAVVQSSEKSRWKQEEMELLQKVTDRVRRDYSIDDQRVAIGGRQVGGVMALVTALENRDLFRGLVMIDSVLPEQFDSAETSPVAPLMILLGQTDKMEKKEELQKGYETAKNAFFPTHLEVDDEKTTSRWNQLIAEWVASLDRL